MTLTTQYSGAGVSALVIQRFWRGRHAAKRFKLGVIREWDVQVLAACETSSSLGHMASLCSPISWTSDQSFPPHTNPQGTTPHGRLAHSPFVLPHFPAEVVYPNRDTSGRRAEQEQGAALWGSA